MSLPPMGVTVTAADFRNHIGQHLDTAQREPVTITNRGRARAVVVSPVFFERALRALEDVEDVAAARAAREDNGEELPHAAVVAAVGIKR